MRKLVIGCGYVGHRVAQMWWDAGDDVFAVTRSEDKAREWQSDGLNPIIADVIQGEGLDQLPEVDVLLYAVGYDRSTGLSRRQVYIDGLQHVLSTMVNRTGRVIYLSSTSVYGQCDGAWIDENSPCETDKENGQICREAEQLVENSPIQHNILRLAGIYGPGRLLRRIADLIAGTPIGGSPESWLNLIHVADIVKTIAAVEKIGEPSERFLVSDNRPIRRRDYYETLAKTVAVPVPEFDQHTETRHVSGLGKRCSNQKIREVLGVQLEYPTIAEGIPVSVAESDLK